MLSVMFVTLQMPLKVFELLSGARVRQASKFHVAAEKHS